MKNGNHTSTNTPARYYTILLIYQIHERIIIVDALLCLRQHYTDAEKESSREN